MDAQGHKGQGLDDMVQPADVVPLMEKDVCLFPGGQRGGQIDPGPQNPHDKGGANVVGQVDVFPQGHRTRQPAA